MPHGRDSLPFLERVDTTGITPEWVEWRFAWYRKSALTKNLKKQSLYALLQIGRWLAKERPQVTSPE